MLETYLQAQRERAEEAARGAGGELRGASSGALQGDEK